MKNSKMYQVVFRPLGPYGSKLFQYRMENSKMYQVAYRPLGPYGGTIRFEIVSMLVENKFMCFSTPVSKSVLPLLSDP